jgi:hypothetical protein
LPLSGLLCINGDLKAGLGAALPFPYGRPATISPPRYANDFIPSKEIKAVETKKIISYQEDDIFIGWLEDFPDYRTQGNNRRTQGKLTRYLCRIEKWGYSKSSSYRRASCGMKRKDLIRRIEELGLLLIRHGDRHDWYKRLETKISQPRPRHREIKDYLLS